jgi:hypothetical protein
MIIRLRRVWASLATEQRIAAACAVALFFTMFLPWYTRDTTAVIKGRLQTVDSTLIAWSAFSFVEAAILLVAVGVLVLLFFRGEGRPFHLPGGDGTVIAGAGAWVSLLVFYRLIDNRDGVESSLQKVDYGVTWGIFVTLLAGVALAYAGNRLRAAHLVEPALPGEAPTRRAQRPERRPREPRPPRDPGPPPPSAGSGAVPRVQPGPIADPHAAPTDVAPGRRPRPARPPIDGGEQLSFDEQE